MATTLDTLPGEIILHIMSYLTPTEAVKLQLVSKELCRIGRDSGFWRSRCFDDSSYLRTFQRRRFLRGWVSEDGADDAPAAAWEHDRVRILANWDPTFPGEKTSWYSEYIQRHGPIVTHWFEPPKNRSCAAEARGVALYHTDANSPCDRGGDTLAVAPLDDGSVCLWDVNGTRGKRGAVVARSAPGLLFVDVSRDRPLRRAELGATECVSVDSQQHLAYFAVRHRLVEVDLQSLRAVGAESFPWEITALSTACPSAPLTVGMRLGVHMHDRRVHIGYGSTEAASDAASEAVDIRGDVGCAPHPQPGPLCILHMEQPGSHDSLSDDIYTAGRIPSILHYDRRKLSAIQGSIHSGASLCGLASLPRPFSVLDSDLRRQGLMSLSGVEASKSVSGGRTLVAGGEYKTKGSLEIYGLDTADQTTRHSATFKNRQTAAFSKILSVANHGTRLVFSDGDGNIKWFERDGVTEVRSWNIGVDGPVSSTLFDAPSSSSSTGVGGAGVAGAGAGAGAGDIARKLLPVSPSSLADNGLLFWTGEKLGLVSVSSGPGTSGAEFDNVVKTEAELTEERQERLYSSRMRQLLEKQANDVRFVRHLGYGAGRRR